MNKQNNTLIICVAPSGSGKTTWCTQQIKENNSNFLRINRDDIRKVLVSDLTNYYNRTDINLIESIVNKLELAYANNIITIQKDILIDNTNLNKKYIQQWMEFAETNHYEVKIKIFYTNLITCQTRVYRREEPENPEEYLKYIDKQYNQFKNVSKWIIENHYEKIIL